MLSIHPVIQGRILKLMNQILESSANSRVIVEVPLLYEAGWEEMFDAVVVVYADYETCLARLMDRDSSEREVAEREMESQLDLGEKAIMADYVVENSSVFHETVGQVEHLAELLRNKGKRAEKKLDTEK